LIYVKQTARHSAKHEPALMAKIDAASWFASDKSECLISNLNIIPFNFNIISFSGAALVTPQ
jgi:hypothetical protein